MSDSQVARAHELKAEGRTNLEIAVELGLGSEAAVRRLLAKPRAQVIPVPSPDPAPAKPHIWLKPPTKFLTAVAISCTHCPLQDPEAVAWFVGRVADLQPDIVIHLGDLFEADAGSKWESEYDWDLDHEFREANAMLRSIRLAAPNARRIMLPGNHDANLLDPHRIPQKIRARCNWKTRQYAGDEWLNEELMQHWEQGVQRYENSKAGVWQLGQISATHSFETGLNAGDFQAIRFCVPNGLLLYGHTHRYHGPVQAMRTRTIALPYHSMNPGTLGPLKPKFVERKNTDGWGAAMAKVHFNPDVRLSESREWDAELELFRMAGELAA